MKYLLGLAFCLCTYLTRAQVYDITNFGAAGNNSTVNTAAIQAAVDTCHNNGGGIVNVPAGIFVTGTVFLKSNVTLHLDSGAEIKGSSVLSNYPDVIPQIRSYADNYPQKSVFYAEGQHNIAITGKGTFNGDGQAVTWLLNNSNRPLGFRFISCTNISYNGLKMRNSAFWMMHNFNIDTLVIKNLDIVNQCYGNNDGVNVDGCRHVLVDSIYADCNDDPLVIKTTSLMPCVDVEVRNCRVATYSRGLKIGTETNGAFKNIYVHHCKVEFSTHGPFGSNTPASCGINLSVVDGGSMENIRFEDIDMAGIYTPFLLRLGSRARQYNDTAIIAGPGFVRNVSFKHITAIAAGDTTSTITGIPGYALQNIQLENIDVTLPGGWPALGNSYMVPENETERPETTLFGDSLPASGLYLRHIDSLHMHAVCFHTQQPDGRPEIMLVDINGLDTNAVCGRLEIPTAIPQAAAVSFKLYPNPVNAERLYITADGTDLSDAVLTVRDVTGRVLSTTTGHGAPVYLQLPPLPSGLYLLGINKNGATQTIKFIKAP